MIQSRTKLIPFMEQRGLLIDSFLSQRLNLPVNSFAPEEPVVYSIGKQDKNPIDIGDGESCNITICNEHTNSSDLQKLFLVTKSDYELIQADSIQIYLNELLSNKLIYCDSVEIPKYLVTSPEIAAQSQTLVFSSNFFAPNSIQMLRPYCPLYFTIPLICEEIKKRWSSIPNKDNPEIDKFIDALKENVPNMVGILAIDGLKDYFIKIKNLLTQCSSLNLKVILFDICNMIKDEINYINPWLMENLNNLIDIPLLLKNITEEATKKNDAGVLKACELREKLIASEPKADQTNNTKKETHSAQDKIYKTEDKTDKTDEPEGVISYKKRRKK